MNLSRSRTVLFGAAVLAGCSGRYSDLLQPNDISATISPSLTNFCVGDTAALRMVIGGQPIRARVLWQSDDPTAGAVDESGILRATKGSGVTIRATLAADTNVRTSMYVGIGAEARAATAIQWIRVHGSTTPANLSALHGAVDIVVGTPAKRDCYVSPTWSRAELRVGAPDGSRDSTVAVIAGRAIAWSSEVLFTLNTGSLPNGTYQLYARYVDTASHLSESSGHQVFTIRNP